MAVTQRVGMRITPSPPTPDAFSCRATAECLPLLIAALRPTQSTPRPSTRRWDCCSRSHALRGNAVKARCAASHDQRLAYTGRSAWERELAHHHQHLMIFPIVQQRDTVILCLRYAIQLNQHDAFRYSTGIVDGDFIISFFVLIA